jgi:hypothetical protein
MANLLNTIQGLFGNLQNQAQKFIDRLFPPEKRAEFIGKLQSFAVANPKLSVGCYTPG